MPVPLGSFGGYPIVPLRDALEICEEHGLSSEVFLGKANSFSIDLGDKPGTGYILMYQSDVDALVSSTASSSSGSLSSYTLMIGDNAVTDTGNFPYYVVLNDIVLCRAVRCFPGMIGDDNSLMLVEISDKRIFMKRSFVDQQYNIHPLIYSNDYYGVSGSSSSYYSRSSSSYYPSTLNSCVLWTWTQILSDLWNEIGYGSKDTTPVIPAGLSVELGRTPDRIKYNALSAFGSYCHALKRIGLALSFDPIAPDEGSSSSSSSGSYTSRFKIVEPNQDDANDWLSSGPYDQHIESIQDTRDVDAALIPSKVAVCFNALYVDTNTEQYHINQYFTQNVTYASVLGSINPVREDAVVDNTISGTVEIIWGDIDARYPAINPDSCPPGAMPAPLNFATIQQRATELATRFYTLRASQYDTKTTYIGCVPYRLSGLVHRVTWYERGEGWRTDVESSRTTDAFFVSPQDIDARDIIPGSGSGASASGGGCDCCNCFNCVPPSFAVVGGLTAAPSGAPYQYIWNCGTWIAYPKLTPNGAVTFSYNSPTNCNSSSSSYSCSISFPSSSSGYYYSCPYDAAGGEYIWRLNMTISLPEIDLLFLCGTNALGADTP